jgi:uncharacterized protein YggE
MRNDTLRDIVVPRRPDLHAKPRTNVGVLLLAVTVLFVSAGLTGASTAEEARRTIVVSGEGQVTGTPDQARLSAGVVTQEPTAAAALDANTRAMNNVFAALKRLGIPDNKIRTSNFSLNPQYSPVRRDTPEARTIVGYQVSNQVSVIVNDIARVGTTLDTLIRSGANQSYGVAFEIADEKPLAERARRAAVTDAVAKARTLDKCSISQSHSRSQLSLRNFWMRCPVCTSAV